MAGQKRFVHLDAYDFADLAAAGEHLGRRRCLTKQRGPLGEAALDRAQPVGKVFRRPPHQEIGAFNGAGESPALAREPELSVDQGLQ